MRHVSIPDYGFSRRFETPGVQVSGPENYRSNILLSIVGTRRNTISASAGIGIKAAFRRRRRCEYYIFFFPHL